MMLFFLVLGVGFGLGHHEYYKSFDGSEVGSIEQQKWALRVGTGLSFLIKTAFTSVIGIAFSQYLWVIARRKALTLGELDAAFTLTSNPVAFLNLGVLRSAKFLVLIGMTSWLLPLMALVTPASLSVESRTKSRVTRQSVPYPDFDVTNGMVPGINSLGVTGNIWGDYISVGWMQSLGPAVKRILTATSSAMSIIPIAAPYPNSSYSIQFYGPSLKCQYLSDAIVSHDSDHLEDFSLLDLWEDFYAGAGRVGGVYYNATAPRGDVAYNMIFVATSPKSVRQIPEAVNITCQLRNASYHVDFTFEQGIPSTTITDLAFEPVLNYNSSVRIIELPPGGRAYVSMLLALTTLLSGGFGQSNGLSSSGMYGADLPVPSTGLPACPEVIQADTTMRGMGAGSIARFNETTFPWMCRNGSLLAALEDLSHNFTLSLLSSATFTTSGPVDVTSFFPVNYYIYRARDPVVSYLVGFGVALAYFGIGAWAYQSNGYSASTSFSTIMRTTRNPQLDELFHRENKNDRNGGRKSSVKSQYGIIGHDGVGGGEGMDTGYRGAFGMEDTVTRTSKL